MTRSWMTEARERINATQADIAELAGVSKAAVSMYESGARTPTVPVAQRLAKALRVKWTLFYTQQ